MSFIVVEGLDGSGKSTQVNMLKDFFRHQGIDFEFLHFPITDSPIFGELIASFLRGDFGAIDQVNPYLVSLLYAGDRNNAATQIKQWLNAGKLILTDRYVYSNIAYQCAKVPDKIDREKLYNWILNMEYEYFKIPKPDLSLFLDVPFDFTKKNLHAQRIGSERDYLKGKQDIHEADLDFQKNVYQTYLSALKRDEKFISINCSDSMGKILSAETISGKLISTLQQYKIFL
jgi:dTMP kinase